MKFTIGPAMFRFSIRELMLVTALAAVCGGWWVDRRTQAQGEEEWKCYATCLESLLIGDGFEILRDKEWVRATRISPCLSGPGSSNTAYAKPPNTQPPSKTDTTAANRPSAKRSL